jgi:hypothetical protein
MTMTTEYIYNHATEKLQNFHIDEPCFEFSAVGFPSGPGSYQSQKSTPSSYNTTASTTSSNLSGWGSAISRKSYACLKTLDETETRKMLAGNPPKQLSSRQVPPTVSGQAWGYFADTIENP